MLEGNAMSEHDGDGYSSVLIIGVGNEYRGDDGLGVHIARELRRHLPERVRIIEQSGEGTALLATWKAAAHVLIVDAVSSHEPPGTIYRLDAIHEEIPKPMFASSSHQFGVAEAVALAKELHELPESLTLYGIEAESFEPGVGLSASVVRSVPDLIHLILRDVQLLVARHVVHK
jgi:hydrogenase maturation protease